MTRGRRLVVGPWLSEVGFEALYWVPFLHWLKTAFNIDPGRVVAVSRGGVAGWYAGVADQYVEIWDHIDPAAFARRNAERGATKQLEASDLDREILDHVARQVGTRDFDVIHPGLMYRLFTLYWSGQRAMGFLDAHTRFTRMEAPRIIDPALLPREYVAVKFYAARSLPDTPRHPRPAALDAGVDRARDSGGAARYGARPRGRPRRLRVRFGRARSSARSRG